MQIHLSSATIQSYENKDKFMDLFYNPIVIFETKKAFTIEQLKDVSFFIEAQEIGTHEFTVQLIQKPALEDKDDKVFLEFRLSKKDVPFVYDNYSCKIRFSAKIDLFDKEDEKIECEVLGIVKTKWSKGLV